MYASVFNTAYDCVCVCMYISIMLTGLRPRGGGGGGGGKENIHSCMHMCIIYTHVFVLSLLLQTPEKQKPEVLSYFKNFEAAEKDYLSQQRGYVRR